MAYLLHKIAIFALALTIAGAPAICACAQPMLEPTAKASEHACCGNGRNGRNGGDKSVPTHEHDQDCSHCTAMGKMLSPVKETAHHAPVLDDLPILPLALGCGTPSAAHYPAVWAYELSPPRMLLHDLFHLSTMLLN